VIVPFVKRTPMEDIVNTVNLGTMVTLSKGRTVRNVHAINAEVWNVTTRLVFVIAIHWLKERIVINALKTLGASIPAMAAVNATAV